MIRFHKIGFMCVIITCLSLALAETRKKHTSTEATLKSSSTAYSSNFSDVKQNEVFTEYVREHNVSQRWKSMESSLIKIFTAMYNETLPIMSQVTKNLDISSTCKSDLMKMLKGIAEFKYWAVQMFDSFGKIPIGYAKGTVVALGDFDQCLNVDVPGHFQGQYCHLDFILPLPKRQPFIASDTHIPEMVNSLKPDGYFKRTENLGRFFYSHNPRTSICVPSTCSKDELQKIANKAVKTMDLSFGLRIKNCEVLNEEDKFDSIEISLMIMLGTLLLLATAATAVDIYLISLSKDEENYENYTSLPIKYLLCFSLYSNAKRLFRPEKDSIQIFHGMRVLATLWVILLHSCLYQSFGAAGGLLNLYYSSRKIPFQIASNGFINVQIFFFMSGTLHAFRTLKMKERLKVKKHILRRIWRLVPAFMFVIACVILSPHFGSGPVWKETMRDLLANKCRKNWWTNLIFINNFMPNKDLCLQWLWYIPADFHLYVLSLIALIPMKSNPTLGLPINFLIMIVGMIVSASLHVYYNLTPMLVLAYAHPEDVSYFLERGYFRTYLHCSSVCIGLATGYFLVNRPPKLHIPWKISAPLWLASVAACLTSLFGVYIWNQGTNLPSIGVAVLYACGSKIAWALAMAWLTIACMTGNGGIANKILSLPIFLPLGRLCYMVYLIHSVIHYMYVGSNRVHLYFDTRTIGYMYCGTVFISFICASILTLFFESPFMALDKLIFAEKGSERTKQLKTLDRDSSKNGDTVKDMVSDKKGD